MHVTLPELFFFLSVNGRLRAALGVDLITCQRPFLVLGSEWMLSVDLVKAGELPDAGVEGHGPCGKGWLLLTLLGLVGLDSCLCHLL